MFETKEKKQIFANWLWKVANADGNLAKEEIQILNNIGLSLGLQEIKYQELGSVEIDNVERTFLLRELYRLSVSDKEFAEVEKSIIEKYIKEFNLNKEIVSATEKWAVTYLENEKKYFETIDKLLAE